MSKVVLPSLKAESELSQLESIACCNKVEVAPLQGYPMISTSSNSVFLQVIATAQHIGYGHFMMVVKEIKLCVALARVFAKLGCVFYNAGETYKKTPLLKSMTW